MSDANEIDFSEQAEQMQDAAEHQRELEQEQQLLESRIPKACRMVLDAMSPEQSAAWDKVQDNYIRIAEQCARAQRGDYEMCFLLLLQGFCGGFFAGVNRT